MFLRFSPTLSVSLCRYVQLSITILQNLYLALHRNRGNSKCRGISCWWDVNGSIFFLSCYVFVKSRFCVLLSLILLCMQLRSSIVMLRSCCNSLTVFHFTYSSLQFACCWVDSERNPVTLNLLFFVRVHLKSALMLLFCLLGNTTLTFYDLFKLIGKASEYTDVYL